MPYSGSYSGSFSGAYFGGGGGSDPTEVLLRFLMPSFTDHPFNYPMVSDRVNLEWDVTNVDSIKVWAVGVDGSRKLITDNAQGTFRLPNGDSVKWNTSLIEDFGNDYLSDTYDPVAADDDSPAMVGDPDRVASFELLPAFTCLYLEFEITKVSGASTVLINHPEFFLAPLIDAWVWHETGALQAITFKDGPVVRPGSQSYFNYLADLVLTTPLPVDPVFGTTTIGDGWSIENCYFKGVIATDGNLTRMGAEYLEGEEFPAGITKHLWRYKDEDDNSFVDSISFWANSELGPKLLYYSSWRASSPSIYFLPTKLRSSASGWDNTGVYGLWRYTYGTSKHPHVVPGALQPQLKKDGLDTLAFVSAPHGWSAATFQGSVDNNEGYDWEFWWDGTNWFNMRPWRGQTSVLGMGTGTAKALDYAVSRSKKQAWALDMLDRLVIRRNDNAFSLWVQHDVGPVVDVVKITWDKTSVQDRLWLLRIDGGVLTLCHSTTDLASYTATLLSYSADMADLAWTENGLLLNYYIVGNDLFGKVFDANLNLAIGPITTNITGIDTGSFLGIDTSMKDGKIRVSATYTIGGTPVVTSSTDFTNFS